MKHYWEISWRFITYHDEFYENHKYSISFQTEEEADAYIEKIRQSYVNLRFPMPEYQVIKQKIEFEQVVGR